MNKTENITDMLYEALKSIEFVAGVDNPKFDKDYFCCRCGATKREGHATLCEIGIAIKKYEKIKV